jgi:predicted cupin superfamily sugar epimerase
MADRAAEWVAALGLVPHPEGGWYREWFRAEAVVQADAGRTRRALTCIDFLLAAGQFSAWHRVASDELWHLLEGRLRLWTMAPTLDAVHCIELDARLPGQARHAVPAQWWQAAEPVGELAYCNATVGPGFEFADFTFLRDDAVAVAALGRLRPEQLRLR